MQIVPLQPTHWEEAAALVAARVAALRSGVPSLPARYSQPDAILPALASFAGHAPGVAALQGGRLVGFLTAMSLPSIKGKRAAFSPECAHAASEDGTGAGGGAIFQAMYAALAPTWLANGCFVHALRVLAHNRQGLEGLYWLGFGLNNVDAVRDLSPLDSTYTETEFLRETQFRRTTADDLDAVAALGEALQRHLAAPPIYLPLINLESRADHAEWLAQPGHVQWLAQHGGEVVAELRLEPSNHTACAIAADPSTLFITSAYTLPAARRGGLAAALLAEAMKDAQARGYVRVATDFESANLPGAAFWMRHFQPIAYSVVRYVDERTAYAHAQRRVEDFWS
jgi:GNAT superfamily N-acetyltransferase